VKFNPKRSTPNLFSLSFYLRFAAEGDFRFPRSTLSIRLSVSFHGEKGFVIPTKSFVKIGITKNICYNNEMFSSINKTFGCCSKIFG